MSERKELIAGLEAATGPDRGLSDAIWRWSEGYSRVDIDPYDSAGPRIYAWKGDQYVGEISSLWDKRPHYTASLDAAIALVERVLPGWQYTIASTNSQTDDTRPWADVASPAWIADENQTEQGEGRGATPAIALLIALLSAGDAK